MPTGCIYGLIGPGAASKSVLLKILTGLLKPDAGKVTLGSDVVTGANELELRRVRGVGMLFRTTRSSTT